MSDTVPRGRAVSGPAVRGGERPVAQRLVIVAPTSVRWDSRTHRIAAALAARGHEVIVLGRAEPGLPSEEDHPTGYRIRRVAVAPLDGVPIPEIVRRGIRAAWSRRPKRSARSSLSAAHPIHTYGTTDPERKRAGLGVVPRGVGAGMRIARIVLTVRAQANASRAIDPGADLYHGMAYMGIPVALALAGRRGAPVVYDARDIYRDAANLARLPGPARAVIGRLERRWARRASRVVTVNDGYARVMAERWAIPTPAVVMNCSDPVPIAGRPRRFHERLGLAPEAPVVLYHGGFSPDRGIEQLIEAVSLLPGVHLVCLGYGRLEPVLRARAAASDGRLHVLPAVPPEELLWWVASADVVAIPIQPTTLNHRLTTPNKLFEALAAGVPIVAADLPGMAPIVRETGAGVLCDPTDPASIAAAIRGLLERPEAERRAIGERGRRAAATRYNWTAQLEILLAEYGRLTGRPW